MAEWKPRWQLLHVLAVVRIRGSASVFFVVDPRYRSEYKPRFKPVDPPPSPTDPPEVHRQYWQRVETEQEACEMDYSHVPPLRVANRYRRGRPKPRSNPMNRSGDEPTR